MTTLKDITDALYRAKKVAIFTHINPDGDALGSAFAIKAGLLSMQKEATVFLESPIPEKFEFLNGGYELEGKAEDFDTAIALDSGSLSRLGRFASLFSAIPLSLVLDHHFGEPYGDIYYVETDSAACAELAYMALKRLCPLFPTKALVPLFTGLSTDTGQFKYSSVTPRTHRVAADLIEMGLDHRAITRMLYDTVKLGKLKFTGALADKIQLYHNGKIAVLECFDDFVSEYGLVHEEIEELPNTVLSVEGVEVSIVIKNKDENTYKLSLRCKENIDLARLAADYGGGGHTCAAGLVTSLTPAEITEKLVQDIAGRLEAYHG